MDVLLRGRFARAYLIIAAGILLGRIAGLGRDITLASTLGLNGTTDVAIVVLTFPDLLSAFLIGGVVSAVLVPEFTVARIAGSAHALFVATSLLVAGASVVIAIVCVVAAPALVVALGPGLSAEQSVSATAMLRIATATFPLLAMGAVSAAYLQSSGRFLAAAAGAVLYNSALIVAIATLAARNFMLIPLGAVGGGAVVLAVQLLAIATGREPAGGPVTSAQLRAVVMRYPSAVGVGTIAVLIPYIGRAVASGAGPGEIATLTYALRLVEFPLGAFVTVASVAALPHLSEMVARGQMRAGQNALADLVGIVTAIAIPVTIAGVAAADAAVVLLFGRGEVSAEQAARVADVARVALLSLPAQGLNAALLATLVAQRRLARASLISGLGVLVFTIGSVRAGQSQTAFGIAVAYSIAHTVITSILIAQFRSGGGIVLVRGVLTRSVRIGAAGAFATAPFLIALLVVRPVPVVEVVIAGTGAAMGGGLALFVARYGYRSDGEAKIATP